MLGLTVLATTTDSALKKTQAMTKKKLGYRP